MEATVEPIVRSVGAVHIVGIQGRMTLGSKETDAVGATIRDLLHDGKRSILLDLRGVTYIDSASLGVLVAHLKRTAEKGGALKLLGATERVQAVFVATKLDHVFEIFTDEAEALASF